MHGETADASATFYTIFLQYLIALSETESDEAAADAAECLVALRILHALGVDAGTIPGELQGGYSADILESVIENRPEFVLRINRGIAASGL
jgi:hypothetical protein